MPTIFDTARYILEKKGDMSSMKLQKLCYYSQAWSLVWDDEELFPEDFQAWATGPVCMPLFNTTKRQRKSELSANDIQGNSGNLSDAQKESIDRVLEYYAGHSAQWLGQLSTMEAPYREAHKGVPNGTGLDAVISKESMAMYYGGV